MHEPRHIPGRVTPATRQVLLDFLERSNVPDAVLCLIKGRSDNETEDYWFYGTYGPENIKNASAYLATAGQPLLYNFDNMIFAIPQYHLLNEIIGKEVNLRHGRLEFCGYAD